MIFSIVLLNYGRIKKGHPLECYTGLFKCQARILPLLKLASHFPEIRNMKRLLYDVRRLYNHIVNIDSALRDMNIQFLTDLSIETREKSTSYAIKKASSVAEERELEEKLKKTIRLFKKRSLDIPKHACCSCEKLCFMRDVRDLSEYEEKIENKSIWKELKKFVPEIEREWICNYCYTYIQKDTMPPLCILNEMFTDAVPPEISCLNEYEKLLVNLKID